MNIDTNTIIGKSIDEVQALGLDFGTSYPIVDDDGGVTGIVDGNYPNEFNGGAWEIVNDYYAQATA